MTKAPQAERLLKLWAWFEAMPEGGNDDAMFETFQNGIEDLVVLVCAERAANSADTETQAREALDEEGGDLLTVWVAEANAL